MIRHTCILALVLMVPANCYAQSAPAEPTTPEDKAETCSPQPQCRAQYTILKPSQYHHALKSTSVKKTKALALRAKNE